MKFIVGSDVCSALPHARNDRFGEYLQLGQGAAVGQKTNVSKPRSTDQSVRTSIQACTSPARPRPPRIAPIALTTL